MSVERQTKEKFPKQRRLCEQRRSTVASIRSCPARLGVCRTCGVYGLYCSLGVACVRPCPVRHGVRGTCGGKIIYAKHKKRPRSSERERYFLLLFFWCFFACICSGFRCICFGGRRFSLCVSFGNGSSSCFLIHNRLLY